MNCEKYIGLDVYQATISVAVLHLEDATMPQLPCVWRIVTWEPDSTGNRAAKLRKWAESHFRHAPRGRETMGAAKHAANDFLEVLSRLTAYRSERESLTNQAAWGV